MNSHLQHGIKAQVLKKPCKIGSILSDTHLCYIGLYLIQADLVISLAFKATFSALLPCGVDRLYMNVCLKKAFPSLSQYIMPADHVAELA